jgi:hypothetical protein
MRRRALITAVGTIGLLNYVPNYAADGVISRVPTAGTNYCRLRFPAIREDTLYSSRPQLKDPKDGDIVDFYGPCDYDPLGVEQVRRQRADARRDRRTDDDD